ncbi:MAG: outer membrane lipoprotein carrier protein LolA [Acidobacteriota bacterium]
MSSVPEPGVSLDALAATMKSAPAWHATFTQRYVPAGFTSGSTDHGRVLLAPPMRLRFDYDSASPRVFAVDGTVARLVDDAAGSCDAVLLDASEWGRLPLAALLDPAAARDTFTTTTHGNELRLVPRQPMPELAEVDVVVGHDGLPATVVAVDASGNRNEFTFGGWRRVAAPSDGLFQPSLPGTTPCAPEQR